MQINFNKFANTNSKEGKFLTLSLRYYSLAQVPLLFSTQNYLEHQFPYLYLIIKISITLIQSYQYSIQQLRTKDIILLLFMNSQAPIIPDDPTVVEPIFKQIKNNFKSGTTISPAARKHALKRLLQGYQQLKEQFAESHYKDLGINSFVYGLSTHTTTSGDIKDTLDKFESWMKQQSLPTPLLLGMGANSSILYEPLGVVLVISAWNYPVVTALPPVAAAISAGNCVVLKPSEMAPFTSKVLKKLFQKYLDERYYRIIEGKIQVAKAVSKLPFDSICFTGSTMTGRLVAIEAAKNLTPCLLQLGGKCPIIVDQTAKIDSAVLRILMGKYLNCGQTCIGVDHVYVHSSIYKKFREQLLKGIEQGYGQHKDHQDGHYGKIVSQARVNRLEELLKDSHGGTIIYGGTVNKEKLYISPTIVQNPKKDSLMMSEEIFGPIMPLFQYTNLDEVIEEINSRPKPLAVYLFSENSEHVKKVKHSTYSGAFVVNQTLMQMANPHLPFGGVGMSGSGRYHGKSGFLAFSNAKSICVTKAVNPYPMRNRFPPYTQKGKQTILKLAKIGGITNYQVYKVLGFIVLLIALGLIFGLVVLPKIQQN